MVEWLNSLPVTQNIVTDYFDGREITEQNLSVWRQGGFVEWQRNQERRGLMREFLSEAEELEEEIKDEGEDTGEPLTDRLAGMVALELAVLLREAMQEENAVERRKAVLEIARELGRLRRGDHQRRRVVLQEAKWATECDEKFEAECKEMKREAAFEEIKAREFAKVLRQEYVEGKKAGTLTPEREAELREFFGTHREGLRTCGVADLPVDNRPPEQRRAPARVAGGATGAMAPADSGAQSESK